MREIDFLVFDYHVQATIVFCDIPGRLQWFFGYKVLIKLGEALFHWSHQLLELNSIFIGFLYPSFRAPILQLQEKFNCFKLSNNTDYQNWLFRETIRCLFSSSQSFAISIYKLNIILYILYIFNLNLQSWFALSVRNCYPNVPPIEAVSTQPIILLEKYSARW